VQVTLQKEGVVIQPGSLTARGPRELCRERRAALQQFSPALEQIRLKAPKRFSHAREALRAVGMDAGGMLGKSEVRSFFRAFDVPETTADGFFEYLAKGDTKVRYSSFLKRIGPYLELPGIEAAMQMGCNCQARPWAVIDLWYMGEVATPHDVQHCRRQAEHLGLRHTEESRRSEARSRSFSSKGERCRSARMLNSADSMQLTNVRLEGVQHQEENLNGDTGHTQGVATGPALAAPSGSEAAEKAAESDRVASPPQVLLAGGRPVARPFGQPRTSPAPHRGRVLVTPPQ